MQETRPYESLHRMFFLKEDVFEKLEALAKREKQSLEAVVTQALCAYEAELERQCQKISKTEAAGTGRTVSEVMAIVEKIGGVPVRFTPSFAFGGITLTCREEADVFEYANEAWHISPTSEVLVEKLT